MKVVIGSLSPVKEEAVKRAFVSIFSNSEIIFETVHADSKVSAQPSSHGEAYLGALSRVQHSKEINPSADFYIGLEGGVEEIEGEMHNFGWVIIESKSGKIGVSRTVTFVVPKVIKDLMKTENLELSEATNRIFLKNNTKLETGTIGPLTKNIITYTGWYESAVVCALVPFINEKLY